MTPTQTRSFASQGGVQGPPLEPDQPGSQPQADRLFGRAFLAWLGIWLGLALAFEWANVALTKRDPMPGVFMRWTFPIMDHPYRSSLGIALLLGAMRGRERVPGGMK